MWQMIWPILLVVGSNTLYNISTKSTPEDTNSFAALCVTYAVALASSLVMLIFNVGGRNIGAELTKTNWSSIALGLSIIGLEFGYICIYRAGWKVSTGNLVANLLLACVLLVIGMVVYKETLSVRQLVGMGVCLLGLILIAK